MHELSITQEIVDIAVNEAFKSGAKTVKQINLVIGEISSVIDESVQFYFDFLSKGTPAEGAKLSFNRIPLRLLCQGCQKVFTPCEKSWLCPECRKGEVDIVGGKESYIESIEVE